MLPADAVIGVALFGDDAPASLGSFSLAFVALFRVAAGETSVVLIPVVWLQPWSGSVPMPLTFLQDDLG